MRKAEAAGNDDCPVKIKLVAPPLYVLTTHTLDKVSILSLCFGAICVFFKRLLTAVYGPSLLMSCVFM